MDSFWSASDISEPTLHKLESRASVSGLEKIRKEVMEVVTESAAMPIGQVCLNCKRLAPIRCQECGPLGYFCFGCFEESHRAVNLFHVAEK